MKPHRLWLTGLALLALAAGCSDDPEGKPVNASCATNNDCADHVCHSGVCASADPLDVGKPCQGNGQCKSYNCRGGICRKGITEQGKDCLRHEECLHGRCSEHYGVCGGKGADGGPPDSGKPDAPKPDAPRPDAPKPDAPKPDAPPADKAIPDKTPPDTLKPDASLCGNGKLDVTEACDGTALGGKTCKTQGFMDGTLGCKKDCSALDLRGCYTLGSNVTISSAKSVSSVAVTASVKEFWTAWADFTVLYANPVSAAGKPGSKITINATGTRVGAASDGKDYLLAWNGLRVTTISAAGKVKFPSLIIGSGSYPAVTWDGTNYLVVFIGGSNKIFTRQVNPYGTPLGTSATTMATSPYTNGLSLPDVAFDGTRHLVVWTSGQKAAAFGRFVDKSGTLSKTHDIDKGKSGVMESPAVAWGGNTYMVVWRDTRSGPKAVVGALVNSSGTVTHKNVLVAMTKEAKEPEVVYVAGRFLVTWRYTAYSGSSIRGRLVNPGDGKTFGPVRSYQGISSKTNTYALAPLGNKVLLVFPIPATSGQTLRSRLLTFGK